MYLFLTFLLLSEATAIPWKRTAPNIIFILGDDVGWSDVSFHGSPQIPTPNLDAIAADGIILNNYYVQPICTPSRAALMTGMYPFRIGMQYSVILPSEPWGLPLDVKIMPEYFRDLGYKTHMVGKWHLGYFKKEYTPTERGFDTFYGFYNGEIGYYNHTLSEENHEGLDFWDDSEPLWAECGNYSTNLFAERARQIIRKHDQSKPLFLYLSTQSPHNAPEPTPLVAPENNVRKFPYIGERNRTLYAGMLDALDQSVGVVVEALSDTGMLDNTIIVFTSDNGASPWGTHGNRGFNWPLRGAKFTLWEGGIRASAFIWSPLLRNRRRVSNDLMHITDWLPTLYAAAGGDPNVLKRIDGINMWHRLSLGLPSPRFEIVHNINPIENTSSIRLGRFKLVLGTSEEGLYEGRYQIPGGSRPYRHLDILMAQSKTARVLKRFHRSPRFPFPRNWRRTAIVSCDHSLEENFKPSDPPYLFDIENDPCELNDLSGTRIQLLNLMWKRLDAHAATQVKPLFKPSDPNAFPHKNGGTWRPWR